MLMISAIAALVGGLAFVVKAVAILATGDQPPLLFEVAPIFFAIALYGLLIYVVDPSGAPRITAKAGIAVVIAAAFGGLALGSDGPDGSGSQEALSSLFDVVSGFGPIILLVGLGVPLMRRRLWEGYWRFLPIGLGLGMIPALAVGTILAIAFGERYLEVPLVAIGGAWMVIGYRLKRSPA